MHENFNIFQLLLKIYYEKVGTEESSVPILIEFRYDDLIYSSRGCEDIFKMRFDKTEKFRKQL